MNPYSDTKILFDLKRLEALRRGEQIVPQHVQIILSDLCNHDCGFCAYRMTGYTSNQWFGETRADGTVNNNPNRMIKTSKALEILDDCAAMGVGGIQFTGGGEPTVHKDHISIFSHALDLGLRCALVTNGNILRTGWSDVLPLFTWLRVSLDAGNENTYSRIRRVSPVAFHKALTNIRFLRDEIDKRGTGSTLGVGFVVTRENYREVAAAAALAKAAGAHNMRIGAVFSTEGLGYYEDIHGACVEHIAEARSVSGDGFDVVDLFGQRIGDLEHGAPSYSRCYFQEYVTYIGADLNVYRCCNTAYNAQGFVGSLMSQRFQTLWSGETKNHSFESFDPKTCQRCQFNGKNQLLNSVVTPPLHPDFP